MSRIEVRAAWAMGIALPLLETMRRRTNFNELAFYVDDYIAGGIILWAAWAASRGRWYGNGALIGAWGILCGGLYSSFFGQLLHLGTQDISGLPSSCVAAVKGLALAVSLVGLALSVRALRTERTARGGE